MATYKAMIVSDDDNSRGYWVVIKDGEFYRGTIYTTMADAAILNAAQLGELEAKTPAGYLVDAIEVQTNEDQPKLELSDTWQTQARGTNSNEYEIYVSCIKGSGEYIKTYEEWINS